MTAIPTFDTARISAPRLGLGTFGMRGAECADAVARAIQMGYRHIDTAQMYGNEDAVGAAIAGSLVARRDLFITTKVWWDQLTEDGVRRAAAASLARLGAGYVDLYLIHWPAPDMDLDAALRGLAAVRREGLARAVGVANFPSALLRRALDSDIVPIASLQVEYHVYLAQARLLAMCREAGIALTAYTPLAKGSVAHDPIVTRIAKKHGASEVQIALAWLLAQDNVLAIPKSARAAGQRANLDACAILLDASDMATLAGLPKNRRMVDPGFAPEWDR